MSEQRHAGTAADTRIVTPENPLIINETEVAFEHVVIEGGEILAQVETKVLFNLLQKKS